MPNVVNVNTIQIRDRTRKDFGNLDALAASIELVGLLHPIGISTDHTLIFGERRLRAFELLGRDTIPARIIDVPNLTLAEHAENEIRKDFTYSERVSIGKAIETEMGNRRGSNQHQTKGELSENFHEAPTGRTAEIAAKSAGFGNENTYRQAKAVVDNATPELVDAMDRGDVSVSTAATLAMTPIDVQRQAVADPKKAVDLAKQASKEKVNESKQIGSAETQLKRQEKEDKREARREENRNLILGVPELEAITTAKFATIVIDPPWDWGDEGDNDQLGRSRPDYATMSMEKLLAFPVGDRADTDCHLYLWVTNRSLPKGFDLMEAWGFRYITCITWGKPSFGLGSYFRGQSEQILFGVKGSQPLKRKDASTFFYAPRGPNGHSSKPIEFYPFVESCSPGPYLEIFSRHGREGWTAWGEAA